MKAGVPGSSPGVMQTKKWSLKELIAISTNTQKRTICVASRMNPNAAYWEGSHSLSIGGLYNALDDTEAFKCWFIEQYIGNCTAVVHRRLPIERHVNHG